MERRICDAGSIPAVPILVSAGAFPPKNDDMGKRADDTMVTMLLHTPALTFERTTL